MDFIFWCEFPHKTNWDNLAKWLEELDMNIVIYVASSSRKNYDWWVKEVKSKTDRIEVNAWPILTKKDGYWFSGHCSKESIDMLDDFKDVKFKVDIEPPIPREEYTDFVAFKMIFVNFFKKCPNKDYLRDKILKYEDNVLVSTFPLYDFMLKRWGWVRTKNRNYMHYISFVPKQFRWLYNLLYKTFMWGRKDSYFAVGLIDVGIFNNEPVYENISEFEDEISFLKKNGAKKVIVFRIGGISNKSKTWLEVVKKYI
jgi:hypothetical protein